jgi:hypothetical protein
MARLLKRYRVGVDFTDEQYRKWREQLAWWVESSMPKVKEPLEQTEKYLLAALNGTKVDGTPWSGVSNDFYKRIRSMTGFDLEKGIGFRKNYREKPTTLIRKTKEVDIPPIDPIEAFNMKDQYKENLLEKYPHLANPVYAPKVEELAETVVRGRMMSKDFMVAGTKELERINKVRESLNRQVKDLMDFLEISPKLLVDKQRQTDSADVGSLVAELESYGELWQDYERLDALRELIQKYRQITQIRPDGSQQLADWELWHMTRTKPIHFQCRCGETYTLLDGFTPEEIEKALLQAQEIYGFGLEGIEGKEYEEKPYIDERVLPAAVMSEEPKEKVLDVEEAHATISQTQTDSGEGTRD